MEVLRGPLAKNLSNEALQAALLAVRDHKVEVFERPSKHPGIYGYPGSSPKQAKVQEAFFSGKYRIIAASGANQSAKTIAIGGMCFGKWLRDHAQTKDIYWVVSQSRETMRDVPQKTIWDTVPHDRFPNGLRYSPKLGFGQIPTLELKTADGIGSCEVWFKTEEMDIKSFESSRVSGIWWTECTREQIFYAIQPRLAAKGGWILMDYVPTEGWHTEKIHEPAAINPNGYVYHMRFAMMDNAHNLPEGTIEYTRSQLSEEEAAIRIDGKDGAGFGVVYKQFVRERHVVPPHTIPEDCPRWRCLDYGYRNPTACLWVAALPANYPIDETRRLPHGGLVVYREYHQSERTVKQVVTSIKEMSDGEVYRGPVIADPATTQITQANGKSIAQEYRDAGLQLRSGMRVNQYGELAMVENVRRLFEADQLYFFNTCPRSIYEHRVWKVRESRNGLVGTSEPFEDKNNHAPDALKLLVAERPIYSTPGTYKVVDMPGIL